MGQNIAYNTTSPTVTVFLMDAAGQPATGATGMTAKYRRDKGALADATSVTEVDATNMAGVYDVVLPDAAALVGASELEVAVKGADVVQANGRETVTLGPLVATEEAAMVLPRPQGDTQPIAFTWPVSGATITATRSIDGGASAAVTGAITQAADLGDEHWYELAFNAADRPTTTGEVVYTLTDGTTTRYLRLRVLVGAATSSSGGPVDGLSRAAFEEMQLAQQAGVKTLVDNGDGTKTRTYFKQDGTTPTHRITFDANGQHTATEVLSS